MKVNVKVGDWVNHPWFGKGKIIQESWNHCVLMERTCVKSLTPSEKFQWVSSNSVTKIAVTKEEFED